MKPDWKPKLQVRQHAICHESAATSADLACSVPTCLAGWRPLYLRLRGFHRQLESREPSKLGGQWMGAPSVNIQASFAIYKFQFDKNLYAP